MPHPLVERIPENSEFRVLADSAFNVVDRFRGSIRDIRADKRLSAQGHIERIAEAGKNPLAYLRELRSQVESERQSLEKRRSHFALPVPKRDDIVGELQRQEIRAWLRSIPNPGERIKYAASNPDIAMAVVNSPAELSGLVGDGIVRAREFLLDHLHGPQLATLRQEGEILENVTAALAVAEQQVKSEIEPTKSAQPVAA